MSDRLATVLFADVSGSTKLYETAGDDAALEAISACLDAARKATESAGGRVIKTIGDEVMSVFPSPDAAANAAAEMQGRIEQLPPVAGTKLGMHIGFHHGPVLQRDDDVFGDTVNLASRLASQAKKGEIITSTDTAGLLGPVFRGMVRAPHVGAFARRHAVHGLDGDLQRARVSPDEPVGPRGGDTGGRTRTP